MTNRQLLVGALTLLLSAAATPTASATPKSQTQQRVAWLAWHGCWSAEGAPADELLCIVPDGDGVRMITTQRRVILAESRVVADGKPRAVRYGDCSGSELAYWSTDRTRVFLKSDLTCTAGGPRNASGMFAFIGSTQWLSVQAVTTGDQVATAAVRYTAVEPADLPASVATALAGGGSARVAAREAAARTLDDADVTEVANNVDPNAVEEWLRITNLPYQVGSAELSGDAAATGVTSALDLASRTSHADSYTTSEIVHVVERPIYTHKTFVFGGRYFGRYSPWGYDWYGWRVVHSPLIYVRSGPIVISTGLGRYYPTRIVRDHRRDGWQPNWRDGRVTRSGYTRGREHWQSTSNGRDGRSGRERARSQGDGSRRDGGARSRRH